MRQKIYLAQGKKTVNDFAKRLIIYNIRVLELLDDVVEEVE
jgi:hypothetical protein